ncbi:MAG: ATP-binding cassette domain-containing protein [Caldilineaceae bacterium]|nr:ATP-binding cassette domain-containing protein [Caldilineaceae bacterium]
MVTHDRHFLDRVVHRIVELDRRQLVSYTGNYTRYLELRQLRHERLALQERQRQKLLKRELEWIRRTPMARGTKQKARRQRVAELQRIQYDSDTDRVVMALATRRLGKTVLTAKGLTKSYAGATAVNQVDFELEPGDRIGLLGPNGAGKSTFLDMLAARVNVDAGQIKWGETVRLGYYDQQTRDLNDAQRLIEFIEEEAPLIQARDGTRVEAAQMMEWFLFPRKMQWGRIGSLSGGERRRLYLLRTLVHQPNVLLLDEPTNDLDVQTLTVLEEFLDAFTGCLIVASHDRYFLDRTVDFIIPFEDGRLGKRYPAPYETYRRLYSRDQQARRPDPSRNAPAPGRPTANGQTAPRSRPTAADKKLSWKEKQELARLETEIAAWEEEQARLQQQINGSGSDYQALQSLSAELTDVESSLESAFERWAELSERQQA